MASQYAGPLATPLMMPEQSPYMIPSASPSFYGMPAPDYGQQPFITPLMASAATPAFYAALAAASPQVAYQTIQTPIQFMRPPQHFMQTPSTIQTVMMPHFNVQMVQQPPPDYVVVQKHQPVVHSL